MTPCPSPYPGAFFVICATLVVITLVCIACKRFNEWRDRQVWNEIIADARKRRFIRKASELSLVPEDIQ